MYWSRGSDQEGLLDKFISLGREGLERLLDLDCVILRVKNGDERLLHYLAQPEILPTLLGYACGRGLHGEEALRFPLVACEILCTDQSTILAALRRSPAALQELWVVPREDMPPLLVCWARLVNFLLGKLPHEMALALQQAPSAREDGRSEFLVGACEKAHLGEVCDVLHRVLVLPTARGSTDGGGGEGVDDGRLLEWIVGENQFFGNALRIFDQHPVTIGQLLQGILAFPYPEDFPDARILAAIVDGLEGPLGRNFAEPAEAPRRFAALADMLGMLIDRVATRLATVPPDPAIAATRQRLADLLLPHIPRMRELLATTSPDVYRSPSGAVRPVGLVRLKVAQISADLLLLEDARIAARFRDSAIPSSLLVSSWVRWWDAILRGRGAVGNFFPPST